MTEKNPEERPAQGEREGELPRRLEEQDRVVRETREAGQRAQGGGEADDHEIETSASRTP